MFASSKGKIWVNGSAQAVLLQLRAVVVVEVVHALNGMPIAEQALDDMETDEAGGTGNEDHGFREIGGGEASRSR